MRETGKLQFFANGEDFIRQPFIPKAGWEIAFTSFYVNIYGPTAIQGMVEEGEPEAQTQVASRAFAEGRVMPALRGGRAEKLWGTFFCRLENEDDDEDETDPNSDDRWIVRNSDRTCEEGP